MMVLFFFLWIKFSVENIWKMSMYILMVINNFYYLQLCTISDSVLIEVDEYNFF